MPYNHADKLIPRNLDRRIKRNQDIEDDVKNLYKDGESIRGIARKYNGVISRRSIQFILFPNRYAESLEKAKKWRKENGNTCKRYGRKKWSKIMREHRRYKESIKQHLIIKTK